MAGDTPNLEDTARWGRNWQTSDDWSSHTVSRPQAEQIAAGYVMLLRKLGQKSEHGLAGIGIGSGAAHLEAALEACGYAMTASEWNDDGLRLIEKQNPQLERRLADLMTFREPSTWDLIVCRELYPFTRTNDYGSQFAILSRLVDSLRPGGVLLLSGSDVSKPNCLDYRRAMRELAADRRVETIAGPVLELLLKRFSRSPFGAAAYPLQNIAAELALALVNRIRRPRIAGIRLYAIRRAVA